MRDTRIRYRYDRDSSRVVTTYQASTEPKEGTNRSTVFALYRHQHLNAGEKNRFEKFTYASPRGEMKVLAGRKFTTVIPFLGVLPALPVAAADKDMLAKLLESDFKIISSRAQPFEREDTYWNGKEFGKFAELIQIAEQLGKAEIRDRLLSMLKERVGDWLAGKGQALLLLRQAMGHLDGLPRQLWIVANSSTTTTSTTVTSSRPRPPLPQYDPEWVKRDQYGGMIDLLIRDCANHDRSDERFPWMRNLDSYAGHSWAAGHAGFASGNNQESSSESMNFATALILYGQVTKREDIRDLGIYWHSTEAEAIRHYWFDEDRAVFPDGYRQSCVGMVWGDGGSYGTWWTANPEEIHGINFLPLNGGSLYLGRNPGYVRRNFSNLETANGNFHRLGFPGNPDKFDRWQDILFQYLALADPAEALTRYGKLGPGHVSEFGETRTHTRQWLDALNALGTFKAGVGADHPLAVAFSKSRV